jgi:hypothetical protein
VAFRRLVISPPSGKEGRRNLTQLGSLHKAIFISQHISSRNVRIRMYMNRHYLYCFSAYWWSLALHAFNGPNQECPLSRWPEDWDRVNIRKVAFRRLLYFNKQKMPSCSVMLIFNGKIKIPHFHCISEPFMLILKHDTLIHCLMMSSKFQIAMRYTS